MRKTWDLAIGGATHRVEVRWDLPITSRGEARVDGRQVRRWFTGVKLPGVTESFEVGRRTLTVRQSMGGFDLDLRATPDVRVVSGEAPYAGNGRNLSRATGFAIGIAVTVVFLALLAALALAFRRFAP